MSSRGMACGMDDLERGEVLKKGEVCIQRFKALWQFPAMRKLSERQSEANFVLYNQTGELVRRLMTDIEFFIKACDKNKTQYCLIIKYFI